MKLYPVSKLINSVSKSEFISIMKKCIFEEKFDTHYVKVKILGSKKIVCCKSDGRAVTSEDIILNKMWSDYVEDFAYLQTTQEFQDFIKENVGCTLGLFYFPCHKPINIKYNFKSDRLYILHQIYDNYEKYEKLLSHNIHPNIHMPTDFSNIDKGFEIYYPEYHYISEPMADILYDTCKWEPTLKNSWCENIDDIEYIFHYKNRYYQISNNKEYNIKPEHTERSSYEFVLCDFINFFNQFNIEQLRGSYKQIVCTCFNAYIENWEKTTNYINNNVDASALLPPHIGYMHPDNIKPPYITNPKTLALCNESELYKNIFKILLANLKSIKKKKYCVYMNDKQIKQMNNIVKAIKNIKTEDISDNLALL